MFTSDEHSDDTESVGFIIALLNHITSLPHISQALLISHSLHESFDRFRCVPLKLTKIWNANQTITGKLENIYF